MGTSTSTSRSLPDPRFAKVMASHAHTGVSTSTRSATFQSTLVSEFFDAVETFFVDVMLMLVPYMDVNGTVLSLSIDLGSGYQASSNMVARPVDAPMPRVHPSGNDHVLRYQVGRLIKLVHGLFTTLVHRDGRTPAIVVMDLQIGDNHTNSVLRLLAPRATCHPRPTTMPFDAPDDGAFSTISSDSTDAAAPGDGHGSGCDTIVMYPIPLGFNFFAQFERNS